MSIYPCLRESRNVCEFLLNKREEFRDQQQQQQPWWVKELLFIHNCSCSLAHFETNQFSASKKNEKEKKRRKTNKQAMEVKCNAKKF
jgi:hypothetical protein